MKTKRETPYTNELSRLRKLPKNESREELEIFRMQFLLDNAQCARISIAQLEENPAITAQELHEHLQSSNLIVQKQAATEFIKTLIVTREKVLLVSGDLKVSARLSRIGKARELFCWVADLYREHQFTVLPELDRSYPLAIILYVPDKDDFKLIDTRDNVGGFYEERELQPGISGKAQREFPFVVVNGSKPKLDRIGKPKDDRITKHEKGHAENQMLINALSGMKKAVVWGRYDVSAGHITGLIDTWKSSGEKAKDTPEWKAVLSYALTKAKNEILAEYKASHGSFRSHLSYLKERGGLYDYFTKHLLISPKYQKELYGALWTEYENQLDIAHKAVEEIVTQYTVSFRRLVSP